MRFEEATQKEPGEFNVVCYVDADGLAVLRCPQCGASKTIDTRRQALSFKKFKAKCGCGSLIKGRFEFRRYYRRKVSLHGSYRHVKSGIRGKIVVEDISLMGVGFTCLRKQNIQKGDELEVTFYLDNPQKSKVTLRVTVRDIQGKLIGTERCDTHIEQPDLGFYLR